MRRALPSIAGTLTAALSFGSSAHAGPTVAADLDLGTSVGQDAIMTPPSGQHFAAPSRFAHFPALYLVGFRIRAGWRFDLGPVLLVPEVGGGYAWERGSETDCGPQPTSTCPGEGLVRAFGGARAGLSFALAPLVRIEPSIYGHVGYARYSQLPGSGLANDVGVSLDVRLLKLLIVGAHGGYEVVTAWPSLSNYFPGMAGTIALADRWVGYGVHAGVLFW